MEVVDLVGRDRRSLEYRESRMGENSLVRLARCPVFARHIAVVRGRGAPRKTVPLVVGPHAVKAAAAAQFALEVINAR